MLSHCDWSTFVLGANQIVPLALGILTEAALALEVLLLLIQHAKDRFKTIRSHLWALRQACRTWENPC
jgi:hypothetical protein